MKTAEEWAAFAYGPSLATDKVLLQFISKVQSDAARSERERAAAICDESITGTDTLANGESYTWKREIRHYEIAARIRALPDANAPDAGTEGAR